MPEAKILADQNSLYVQIADKNMLDKFTGGEPRETSGSGPAPKPPVIVGGGDQFTATGQVKYPNGETWHIVSLIELRDGKISKMTDYFGAPFEAPAWRAPYVEVEKTAAGKASR